MLTKKKVRKLAQLHGWWIYAARLKKMAAWSPDQREAWLHRHIGEVLRNAFEGTRYYREVFERVGFDPRTDYTGPQVLEKLPKLTKEIVRERFDDLIDPRFRRLSVLAETSGTTGEPMRMLLNESYVALDYACMYQMWAQAGYRFRDRFVALRSYVPASASGPLWKLDRTQNTLFMSAYHLSAANAGEYLQAIREFEPRFLRGYPSSLVVLAEIMERRGERLPGVRGLFTASETLTPPEREVIERVFGKVLFDWYGMTEPTLVAFEGPEHDGLNVVWSYGCGQCEPDDTRADGGMRLVATSLQNPVMPFIRYETGDVVTPAARDRLGFLIKLGAVHGRKDELIATPDGRLLPSVNFYTVFRNARAVTRFQLAQYGSGEVVVNMETADSGFETSAEFARLRRDLGVRLGAGTPVEFRINRGFLTNHDGKTPAIVKRKGNKAVEEAGAYALSSQAAWSRHREGEQVLKLDWNESDAQVCPRVAARLQELLADEKSMVWYPEAYPAALHEAIALRHGLRPEHVLATHGSDMALAEIAQCFVSAGDHVMMVTPCYDQFRAVVEQRGARVTRFEVLGGQEFPAERLAARLREERPRALYLCNPNNPLGYHIPTTVLEHLCLEAARADCLVILDEAYAEFAPEDATGLISHAENLVVTRTFSKAFGLAGLRAGYLLAPTVIMDTLHRAVNPKNLTSFAQAGMLCALEDLETVREHVEEVKKQRARFQAFLEERGVAFYPSHGNFVLFHDAAPERLVKWMETQGIMLRGRSHLVPGTVRTTIGGEAATERLMAELEAYWKSGAAEAASAGARDEVLSGVPEREPLPGDTR